MAESYGSLNALDAFNTAIAFHEGCIRCREDVIDPATGTTISPTSPAVVNAAFAAEMYMKALALRRGKAVEGHNLAWLFKNALTEEERQAIAARYHERTRGADYDRLVQSVERFARAFVEWRYVYEHQERMIDGGALMAFIGSAYMAVRDLVPEWPVHPYLHERFLQPAFGTVHLYSNKPLTPDEALMKIGVLKPKTSLKARMIMRDD